MGLGMSKMYICVREDFPDYMTPTLVGHAVLRHHLEMIDTQDPICSDSNYLSWLTNSFKKCVVKVGLKEFEKIRKLPNVVESWENNTLNGEVSCLTVVTSDVVPNVLKFAKLWKPAYE